MAKAAAAYAHREGLSQQQFSGLLGIYAKNAVSEIENYNRSITAETAKLGPRAAERGRAISAWLTERLGADRAADLTARFSRASDIESFEKLRGEIGASVLDRWYPTR